jgi:hypothetical protein
MTVRWWVSRSWWLVVALAACAPQARNGIDPEETAGAPPELGATLNVLVEHDSVLLELHVTNVTGGVIDLEFATAQRYDFAVVGEAGVLVWQWSDERGFAQVLGVDELGPGESRRYAAAWRAAAHAGEYVVVGRLTSSNYPIEMATRVRLPGN